MECLRVPCPRLISNANIPQGGLLVREEWAFRQRMLPLPGKQAESFRAKAQNAKAVYISAIVLVEARLWCADLYAIVSMKLKDTKPSHKDPLN